MTKLLGAALILGGIIVGGVLFWVLATYGQEGDLAESWLVLIGIVLAAILVLPQLGLGIFILRGSLSPNEEP